MTAVSVALHLATQWRLDIVCEFGFLTGPIVGKTHEAGDRGVGGRSTKDGGRQVSTVVGGYVHVGRGG